MTKWVEVSDGGSWELRLQTVGKIRLLRYAEDQPWVVYIGHPGLFLIVSGEHDSVESAQRQALVDLAEMLERARDEVWGLSSLRPPTPLRK